MLIILTFILENIRTPHTEWKTDAIVKCFFDKKGLSVLPDCTLNKIRIFIIFCWFLTIILKITYDEIISKIFHKLFIKVL
jgi:hypothetical protein